MFCIVEIGTKQFKVSKGTILDVDKLDVQPNGTIVFDNVLLVSDGDNVTVGTPYVDGASVSATALNQYRDKKVTVFKFKRKTGYKKTQGHRQDLTTLRIDSLKASGSKSTATSTKTAKADTPKKSSAPKSSTAKKATSSTPKKAAKPKTTTKKTTKEA